MAAAELESRAPPHGGGGQVRGTTGTEASIAAPGSLRISSLRLPSTVLEEGNIWRKALNLAPAAPTGVFPLAGATAGLAVFSRPARPLHSGVSQRPRGGAAAAAVVVGVVRIPVSAACPLPVLGPRQLPQAPGRVGPQVVTKGPVAAVVARGVSSQGAHQHLDDDHIVALQGRQVGREAAATRALTSEPQPLALGKSRALG